LKLVKKWFFGAIILGVFLVYSMVARRHVPVLAKPAALSNSQSTSTGATSTGDTGASGSIPAGSYKDGTYTGSVDDAFYGNVQVSVTIAGGKMTNVTFLQYPNTHSTSVVINQQAMPYLQQEAIQAQSANVQIISGATYTSQAFMQSLSDALKQA
jgi:uncharacterized protein with FMN-binding domain